MKLQYLLEPAYDELYANIDANRKLYEQDAEWLYDFFRGKRFSKESSVELPKPNLYIMPDITSDEQKSQEDLTNVKLLYDAFETLAPLQATNKYLWTYLSHVTFRKYIMHRWMTSAKESTIATRFFVTNTVRSVYKNAISRLWWYGYISYDKTNTMNPYHLTDILLMNQTICTDFVDTSYSQNRSIGKGVLLALQEFRQKLDPHEGITEYFRSFNKYFNRYGAVSSLDFLDSEDVYNIALDYMLKLRNDKKSNRE
jgi:hypothetical protein